MFNVLVGAHGTGKTTLLEQIKGKVPYFITDGFSRPVKRSLEFLEIDNRFYIEQKIIDELTLWAWNSYIDQDVISTRSIVDTIVYHEFYLRKKIDSKFYSEFQKNKDKVRFFYIPIEFELVKDNVRFSDVNDQKEIDRLLKLFLIEHNINFITLSGSIEERKTQLIKHL